MEFVANLMEQSILAVCMCPITKQRLSLCHVEDIRLILDRSNVPLENHYLVNKSRTVLYRFSAHGYPILLPEEAIVLSEEIKMEGQFSAFREHRQSLEDVYKKIDFTENPFEVDNDSYVYLRTAVAKPLADNLVPGSVLDAGGGFGFFRHFTEGRFHLNLDVSEKMLDVDRSNCKIEGRTESLPILDNSFDNVVSIGSIEHCENVEATLSELARCLKPGGRILLSCYSEDWPRILRSTPWAFTYYYYMLRTYSLMFSQNPVLFIEKALDRLRVRKMKTKKSFRPLWGGEERAKIPIRRFNSKILEKLLLKVGLNVLKKGRSGKNFPGFSPPRKIIDRYFDSTKYGQYLFFVCQKPLSAD